MYTNVSDHVMTCTMAIHSISDTFKKLLLQSDLYPSYIQTIYNSKEESINNIFSTYVESLVNYINHYVLGH